MSYRIAAAAALASLALAAHPAAARELSDGGVTAGEVADALQARGLRAEIGRDDSGDPKIRSTSDGVEFSVYFYDCEAGRCGSIQFAAGFDLKKGMALADMNTWNRKYRFGLGWLDDENDPHVQMDCDVEHGATDVALKNDVERWEVVLGAFKKHIGW